MGTRHHALIVGVGSIGERHLRCFQATGRATAALVETNPDNRAAVCRQYDVTGYESLDAALSADAAAPSRFDLAVVATPAHLHIDQATRLVSSRMHVLIEKPLSTQFEGIDRLVAAAAKHHVVVAVAYVYRCFPALATMRKEIASGRFGRPVELVAVGGQHFPTYRPAYRQTYYAARATGGGAIQDALTHVLNLGEWLLGPIDRLVADAAHQVLPGVEVEDTVHLLARHGDVPASYSLNQHQAPNENTVTVVCERGTVRWESHQNRWRWIAGPDDAWHDEPHDPQARDAAFIAQAHAFMDAVQGHAVPPCSLSEGLQTLRVNLAALASLESRRWERVGGAP
jgi:predicted dehydrogenase